jgi:enoyl-CoA hydratase
VSSNEHSAVFAEPAVRVTRDGPVAVVALARQTKSNAMDGEVTVALLNTLRALSESGDVRAMVLTGDGRSFSAGGDIQTIREMGADKGVRDAILDKHQELFWAMNRLPFATVAAVNGPAVGAGVTVALLCDLVVMAQDAFLSDPRVALGLLDGAGGIVLWPLLTSLGAAKEHLLLGDRVPSAEAHRLGLVNRVVPSEETVAAALDLARRLAALPQVSVREARRLLNMHIERAAPVLSECARAESDCFETDEHRAALDRLSARLATRPPRES